MRTALVCLALQLALPAAVVGEAAGPLVVLLVRHAEKLDGGGDPELTAAGRQRAAALAATLRDAGLAHVHSSDFARTRATAAPTAVALDLELRLYDAADLPGLVARLRETGGRHLVVGHSNTTPEVVKLLGGDPSGEIDEASEFDRLYVVTTGPDNATSTVLLRYGEPSDPGAGVRIEPERAPLGGSRQKPR